MVRANIVSTLKFGLAAGFLAASLSAQGAPLGLTLADSPDIAAGFISVGYSAGSDTLTATGFALQFDGGSPESVVSITGGLFTLSATIDDGGNLSGGSFTVNGTIPSLGANSGTLLTGVLTDFGFEDSGGDPLEFKFDPTGGDLAAMYGPAGGIIMSFTGFTGDWGSDFSNNGTGVADIAAVPLPAAVWLMLSAVAGLVSVRRRRD